MQKSGHYAGAGGGTEEPWRMGASSLVGAVLLAACLLACGCMVALLPARLPLIDIFGCASACLRLYRLARFPACLFPAPAALNDILVAEACKAAKRAKKAPLQGIPCKGSLSVSHSILYLSFSFFSVIIAL